MDWSQWVQQQAGGLLDAYTYKRQVEAYTDAMRLQALGEQGYYVEGQRGTMSPVQSQQTIAGIPSSVLLIGGAVLVAALVLGK